MDYFVPNFGMDRDIQGTLEDTKVAEQIVGHNWTWKEKKKPKVVKYPGEERGLDSDMIASIDNLGTVEKRMGEMGLVQLDSDPICSSAGCDQYKHPDSKEATWDMNYFVPNFGMDRDI